MSEMAKWGAKYVKSLASDNQDLVVNDLKGFFSTVAKLTWGQDVLPVASSIIGQLPDLNELDSIIREANRQWLQNLNTLLSSDNALNGTLKYIRLSELAAVTNSGPEIWNRLTEILKQCFQQDVATKEQVALILGVAGHESQRFTLLLETDSGLQYEGRVDLMNDVRGDGPKYRGRGFVQLTGKIRYVDYSARAVLGLVPEVNGTRLNLSQNPELLERDDIAAFVLVDYFVSGRQTRFSGLDWEYGDGTPRPQAFLFPQLRDEPYPGGYSIFARTPTSIRDIAWDGTGAAFVEGAALVNAYSSQALGEVLDFSRQYFSLFKSFL